MVIEAVKNQKMLTIMESIGLCLGLYGALVLVIPGFFAKLCCFCCLDKLEEKPEKSKEIYTANKKVDGKDDLTAWNDEPMKVI